MSRLLQRLRASRPRNQRGSATVFVIGFSMVLLFAAGLAIDGGLAINKRMAVADDAEQAARIGADSLDVAALRRGEGVQIDHALAEQRIDGYLSGLGYGGSPSSGWAKDVGPNEVTVSIHDKSKTYFLSIFGMTFPVRASAQSVPSTGP